MRCGHLMTKGAEAYLKEGEGVTKRELDVSKRGEE
jgi:hypothetical protein